MARVPAIALWEARAKERTVKIRLTVRRAAAIMTCVKNKACAKDKSKMENIVTLTTT